MIVLTRSSSVLISFQGSVSARYLFPSRARSIAIFTASRNRNFSRLFSKLSLITDISATVLLSKSVNSPLLGETLKGSVMKNQEYHFKNSIIIFFLILGCWCVNPILTRAGNDPKYKVSDISKELKSGALAVIRDQEMNFTRISLTDAILSVREVITILNKKALSDAKFVQYYDKFSKIRKIKAVIYDEYGNVIRKIEHDDIKDISAISGGTLFSDARYKYINPKYRTIPFTVEYIYEIVYSGIINTPSWLVYPGYKTSIEKSSFSVTTPANLELRYYQRNFDVEPKKTEKKDGITVKWDVSNLKALKKEPFSLSLHETTPLVFSAPSEFSIENIKGNSDSWKNFGNWIGILNEGRDNLPNDTRNEIKSLVKDSLSEYEIIKKLYEWMQNKTRYVSIQVGIGGWQPILAEDVDRFSYGDCKALTNYMQSILQVADIKSHYTLVKAGSSASKIISDFPSNQFNHAILCVPIKNDTIWLECTSQQNPFGYIGGFTDDRDVLIITKDGGQLVHTKVYSKDDNYKATRADIKLDQYGDGDAKIVTSNYGIYYDDMVPVILSTKKDRNEMVINSISIPSFELENYSFTETKNIVPIVEEEIDLKIKSYATQLGNRLLFDVNLLNKHNYQFKRSGKRKNDVVIRREIKEIDTIVYNLPKNFRIESLPIAFDVDSDFGNYSTQIIVDSTKITFVRNFSMNKGNYPKSNYSVFKEFLNEIRKSDNQKVVLIGNGVD